MEWTSEQKYQLTRLLKKKFNKVELLEIFAAFGLDYDSVTGLTPSLKTEELVKYAYRRGRQEKLLDAITLVAEDLNDNIDLSSYRSGESGNESIDNIHKKHEREQDDPSPTITLYENFDIRVRSWGGGNNQYAVEVTENPLKREMRDAVIQTFPIDDYDFTDLVSYLKDLVGRGSDAAELGDIMFNLLFPDEVRHIFEANLTHVKQQDKQLRIRLNIAPPELSHFPWEYCRYDGNFLATQLETPLIRYISEPFASANLSVPHPVKILVATAEPTDQAKLQVSTELNDIRKLLSYMGDRVRLRVLEHATPRKLYNEISSAGVDILHFIGHGEFKDGKGMLVLENDSKKSERLDADQLMVLLKGRGIKLVILNACKTAAQGSHQAIMGVAPALVKAEIPAVIAMQFNVPDKTAVGFTRDLYRTLVGGFPLDQAITEMRIGAYIGGNDKYYWGIPVLYMRSPDGVLWPRSPEVLALFEQALDEIREIGSQTLPDLLAEIIQQVTAIQDKLDAGEAQDILRYLTDTQTLIKKEAPNFKRIKRRLENAAEILEDANVANAAPIAAQVVALIEKAEAQFSS